MQFNLLALLAIATTFHAVAATSKPNSLAKCGENPEVMNTTKIAFKDTEAIITTFACPGVAKSGSAPTTLSKRQTDVCGAACTLDCVPFADPTPVEGDCADLAVALEGGVGLFLAPSGTVTTATLGTCVTAWINESADDFEFCFDDWGSITNELAFNCLDIFSGGECVDTAEDWLIEVFG